MCSNIYLKSLNSTWALWRVELSEDVEFVEGGEDHEDEVPGEKDDPELLVQLPPVEVRGHNQKHHRREQAEGRVEKAWNRS